MLSFPLETCTDEDGSIAGTIHRLLEEEVGVDRNTVKIIGIDPGRFQLIPGRDDVEIAYGFGFLDGDAYQTFRPTDNDVSFEKWMTVTELFRCRNVRVETRPILSHFMNNHFNRII